MSERRVTVDRETFDLPEPFMVIATQNLLEYRGTFPLPESQLDRFSVHLKLCYPSEQYEKKAVSERADFQYIEKLDPVVHGDDVLRMQAEVDAVEIHDSVLDYILAIINATRTSDKVRLGASTRGAQFLLQVAKAVAFSRGRGFVLPDDVKGVAPNVLGHRIMLTRHSGISDADAVVEELLQGIPVPV